MPSGQYTLDTQNQEIVFRTCDQYASDYFTVTHSIDETIANGTVSGHTVILDGDRLTAHKITELSDNLISKLKHEYDDLTVYNVEQQKRIDELVQLAGFVKNSVTNNFGLLIWTDGVSNLVVPDYVRIMPNSPDSRSVISLKLCDIARHTSQEEVDWWCRIKAINGKNRIALKTLWGKNDINHLLKRYKKDNKLSANFGLCEYRGVGTIYGVDEDDLRVYNLSHGYQQIIDHYGLIDDNKERISTYMEFHELERKPTLAAKAFQCPYQTVKREELPDNEDTVIGLGAKGVPLMKSVWHDEEIPDFLKDEHVSYTSDDNSNIRKRLLPYMEAVGYVENRQDSAYGLLYREKDGKFIIPDFCRINDRHPSCFKVCINAQKSEAKALKEIGGASLRVKCLTSYDDVDDFMTSVNELTDNLSKKFCVNTSEITVAMREKKKNRMTEMKARIAEAKKNERREAQRQRSKKNVSNKVPKKAQSSECPKRVTAAMHRQSAMLESIKNDDSFSDNNNLREILSDILIYISKDIDLAEVTTHPLAFLVDVVCIKAAYIVDDNGNAFSKAASMRHRICKYFDEHPDKRLAFERLISPYADTGFNIIEFSQMSLMTMQQIRDINSATSVDGFEKQKSLYDDRYLYRETIEPYIARHGFIKNDIKSAFGLWYKPTLDGKCAFIPDYIKSTGKYPMLLTIVNRNGSFNEPNLRYICNNVDQTSSRNLFVFTGVELYELIDEMKTSDEPQWGLHRTNEWRGIGNRDWDLVNDAEFRAFYASHPVKDVMDKYGLNKGQVEHIVYRHPMMKRTDDSVRLAAVSAANKKIFNDPEKKEAIFEKMRNTMEERYGDRYYNITRFLGTTEYNGIPISKIHVSQGEKDVAAALQQLNIMHNEFSHDDSYYFITLPGGNLMVPDYLSVDDKVMGEYDGTYFHRDPHEAEYRNAIYSILGFSGFIVWESEHDTFIKNTPDTIEQLITDYPCDWRNVDVMSGKFGVDDKVSDKMRWLMKCQNTTEKIHLKYHNADTGKDITII